ncbi:MAG: RNA polymerase sigma factor [Candidatus Giovannonibacteria bacterium GW2011_GWA1_43_15]|nr:MAG: RNA polymerase sigma factor [Candidatus Giovannonibacteria bacterium GW2011_GWA1_43_15]
MIAETLADTALLPTELSEKTEKFRNLALAVSRLPQKYGDVITLRYEEYLSFSEISRFLGEKLNTIKSRHRRALMMLKSAFLHQK